MNSLDIDGRPQDRILKEFGRLAPLSYRGLDKMLVEDGRAFCFRAVAGAGAEELRVEGVSERYTAMSVIGLLAQQQRGKQSPIEIAPLIDTLATWAPNAPELGDAGMVLWALVMNRDERAAALLERISARRGEVLREEYSFASMEMGYLLMGLSQAIRAGVQIDLASEFAQVIADRLRLNFDSKTGLFAFGRKIRRKNVHRARMDAVLGSFASQVYPMMGFAFHAMATGDAQSLEVAVRCADAMSDLQGPHGQWWWIYHTGERATAIRYPVYSVHQDSMGPMALAAAALADGASDRYDHAIEKSLAWFNIRPELVGEEMIDDKHGVVWRSVQHDDPETTDRLGLGKGELQRMGWKAWFGKEDDRSFVGGHICYECRPYHLGWVLLADAMYAELLELRGA